MALNFSIDALQTAALRQFVRKITVRTSITPTLTIDDPFAPDAPPQAAGGNTAVEKTLLDLLRPEISIYDRNGTRLIKVALNGDPGDNEAGWQDVAVPLAFGLALLFGLAGYGVVRLIKR